MDYFPILISVISAVAFVAFYLLRSVKCPDCGAPLPLFYSPFRKTRRMWREGGSLGP